MRLFFAVALLTTGCSLNRLESPNMISVLDQSGVAYVPASGLERAAGVVVKSMPGRDEVVVCSAQRCALVKEFVRKGDETWVSTAALEKALGLKPRFSADRSSVSLAL